MSRQESGALGEKIALSYLQTQQGFKDARPLNDKQNNFAVDMVYDHDAIEVKTGLVSNGRSAQQWRATIGQPGKEETKWLAKANASAKAAWNEKKAAAIMDRKTAAVKSISKELGAKVKGSTLTMIVNPDTRTADLYRFSGFHARIAWSVASKNYVGSYKF